MCYTWLRNILFKLDPETAHAVTLRTLKFLHALRLTNFFPKIPSQPREIMGLIFPNPVGLAAGLDKNGEYIDALSALGFGFIEVGTVTPLSQAGNPKPRLFRLPAYDALINRMGFNNAGCDQLIENLKNTRFKGILGINIGKNKETPLEQAVTDYVTAFRKVAPYASYVTINISSPNTQSLRELQQGDLLRELLRALKAEQKALHTKYVPLVVKISPDITQDELKIMATIFLEEKVDGVIATNTTISREGVASSVYEEETGGLSGAPLCDRSTELIRMLHGFLQGKIPIIASGGVMSARAASEKTQAGACLVQVYTGLIYSGPGLIKKIVGSFPL